MSHYEIVNGRLEVRGYKELFESRSETVKDVVCKSCGWTGPESEVEDDECPKCHAVIDDEDGE